MTLRNDIALFAWIFTGVWWAMLLAFTGIMLRDGPPDDLSWTLAAGMLALFWAGGAAAAGWALRQVRVRLDIGPDGKLRLRKTRPFARTELVLRPQEVAEVALEQDSDSDGDPYFRTCLVLRDGRRFVVQEGHQRAYAEAAARRLRAALWPTPPEGA